MGTQVAVGLSAGPIPVSERQRTIDELHALAGELTHSDRAMADLVTLLAESLATRNADEVRAYVGALQPRAIAESLMRTHRVIWGVAELLRGALVLLPIAVTWYGLAAASAAYADLLGARPELVSQPFLLLWQQGFDGRGTALTFTALAALDGTVISVIIALSLVLHYKADVHDPRLAARVLLRESQVRALLARAHGLAAFADASPHDSPVVGAEGTLTEIRDGLGQLAKFAESTEAFAERSAQLQEALLQRLAERPLVSVTPAKSGLIDAANGTIALSEDAEQRVAADTQRLLDGLEETRRSLQVALGSVKLQTDAMTYMSKALVLASERVQVAAQTLGDAAVPSDLFKRARRWGLLAAVLVAIVLLGGAATAGLVARSGPSADQVYVRDLRNQAQRLEKVQSLHLLLPPPRSATNDADLRQTANAVVASAGDIDAWLNDHTAAADPTGLGSELRGATAASRRAAQDLLAWLARKPADAPSTDASVPADVSGEVLYAESLLRDLRSQIALLAAR